MKKKELEKLVIRTRLKQIREEIDWCMDAIAETILPQYSGTYFDAQKKLMKEEKDLIKELRK
jgi:hypothetical protein